MLMATEIADGFVLIPPIILPHDVEGNKLHSHSAGQTVSPYGSARTEVLSLTNGTIIVLSKRIPIYPFVSLASMFLGAQICIWKVCPPSPWRRAGRPGAAGKR